MQQHRGFKIELRGQQLRVPPLWPEPDFPEEVHALLADEGASDEEEELGDDEEEVLEDVEGPAGKVHRERTVGEKAG